MAITQQTVSADLAEQSAYSRRPL